MKDKIKDIIFILGISIISCILAIILVFLGFGVWLNIYNLL